MIASEPLQVNGNVSVQSSAMSLSSKAWSLGPTQQWVRPTVRRGFGTGGRVFEVEAAGGHTGCDEFGHVAGCRA